MRDPVSIVYPTHIRGGDTRPKISGDQFLPDPLQTVAKLAKKKSDEFVWPGQSHFPHNVFLTIEYPDIHEHCILNLRLSIRMNEHFNFTQQ